MRFSSCIDQLAKIDAYSLVASDQHEARASIHRERRGEPAQLARSLRWEWSARDAGANAIRRRNAPVRAFARWPFPLPPQTFRPADEFCFAPCCREAPAKLRHIDARFHQINNPKQYAAGFRRQFGGSHLQNAFFETRGSVIVQPRSRPTAPSRHRWCERLVDAVGRDGPNPRNAPRPWTRPRPSPP